MFANLVRINILKLRKSNFFTWGAIVTFVVTVAFSAVYYLAYKDDPATFDYLRSEDGTLGLDVHLFFFDLTCGFVSFYYGILSIILICDHYRYRELVNIRGAVKSHAKWSLSEIAATVAYAPMMAVLPFIMVDAVPWAMGLDNIIFTPDIIKLVLFFLATCLGIWLSIIPAIFLAKLIRRINISIALFVIWKVVGSILTDMASDIVARMLKLSDEAKSALSAELFDPGSWAVSSLVGDKTGMSSIQITIYSVMFIVFWSVLVVVASQRREEL